MRNYSLSFENVLDNYQYTLYKSNGRGQEEQNDVKLEKILSRNTGKYLLGG
mgnify:CR=1 FL=1